MKFNYSVRGHDMAQKTDIDDLLSIVSSLKIDNIQLIMNKALSDSSFSSENISKIKESFEKHHLGISMLGAYFNTIGTEEEREKGIINFKNNLSHMKELNAPWVGTETGYLKDKKIGDLDEKEKEDCFERSYQTFKELTDFASCCGGAIVIEPAYAHSVCDVEKLQKMVKRLSSPCVHVTIDLLNLLCPANFEFRDQIFLSALKTFGNEVKVVHLKDQIMENGVLRQVAPGKGQFNYPLMMKAVKDFCPSAFLTFEGVSREEISSSYSFVRKIGDSL